MNPIDAIADMVAPVVLISAGAIFANGLLGADTAGGARLHALNSERLSLLGGPHGEKLAEDQVPDINRARLAVIDRQVPLVLARIRGIRDACVLLYIAMALLVLSIVFIAAAIPGSSRPLGYTALALVVAGVIIHFAAIVLVTRVMIRSADTLTIETKRTDELDLGSPQGRDGNTPRAGSMSLMRTSLYRARVLGGGRAECTLSGSGGHFGW